MEAPREEGKKRSPEEETEAEVHQAFRGSANALSQLYARSVATQKASFLAGERRAMEGVYQWISSQPEEASVSVADVFAYVENEIERRGGMAGSPRHSPQPANGSPSVDVQTNTFSLGNVAAALDSQQWQTDQTRTAGISNAHPSLSHQSFYSHRSVQCSLGYGPDNSPPNGDGARSNSSPQNQESLQGDSSEDSSDMDHDAH